MKNKNRVLFFLIGCCIAFLLSCNKAEVYIEAEGEYDCNEKIIAQPKVEVKGDLLYGAPLKITVTQDDISKNKLAAGVAILETPAGKRIEKEFSTLSMSEDDEGTYYAYISNGLCVSKKLPVEIKGKSITVPCSYKDNWLDVQGIQYLQNARINTIKKNTISASRQRLTLFGNNQDTALIIIDINTPTITEGVFDLFSSSNSIRPAANYGKRAYVEFITYGSPKKYYSCFSGGRLYVKKISSKQYNFVICDEPFSANGGAPFYRVKLELTVEE